MAINSEDKRRSALGSGILSMTVMPVPNSDIDTSDRRHAAGWYRGITTKVDTFFFWRKDDDSSGDFTKDDDASWSTSECRPGESSSTWVKEHEVKDA